MSHEVPKAKKFQSWKQSIVCLIATMQDYNEDRVHRRISFRCQDITYDQLKTLSILFSTRQIDVGNDAEWFGDGTAGPWAVVTIEGITWPRS